MSRAKKKPESEPGSEAVPGKPQSRALGLLLSPNFDEGEWFSMFDGAVRLKVRHCTNEKLREIRQGIGLPAWQPDGEKLSDKRQQELQDAILDWTIEDWEGFVAPGGEAAPCTLENKRKAMNSQRLLADRLVVWQEAVYASRATTELGPLGGSSASSDGAPST